MIPGAVWVGGFALVAILYVVRLNDVAGMMVDDAYYILLAKALATGEGYRLISSGATAILPLYPPGFPFVLSAIFRVAPDFPENVWLLKSLSISAMLATGGLTYAWCRQHHVARDLAAYAALALTLTPAFVFLATSTVMSECLFTFVQLAAVFAIHRSTQVGNSRGVWLVILGAALAGAGVLMRSAGIALPAAAGILLVARREWKRAATFGAVATLCVLPWLIYSRAYAPTREERFAHGGSIAYAYQEQLWMRWAGAPGSGTATVADLPDRMATNLEDIVSRGIAGIFLPALFRGPSESGEELVSLGGTVGIRMGSMGSAGATKVISATLGLILVIGFVSTVRRQWTVAELLVPLSLAIVLIWPFWSFRFLLPLTPYLSVYLVTGLSALAARLSGGGQPRVLPMSVARTLLLCVIGLSLLDHAAYIWLAHASSPPDRVQWLSQAREVEAGLAWVDAHAEPVIATTNPALVYLRTGKKPISFDGPIDAVLHGRRDIRYVACFVPVQPPTGPDIKLRFRSPSGFWIAEIGTPH